MQKKASLLPMTDLLTNDWQNSCFCSEKPLELNDKNMRVLPSFNYHLSPFLPMPHICWKFQGLLLHCVLDAGVLACEVLVGDAERVKDELVAVDVAG